jgi:hypothetical protein
MRASISQQVGGTSSVPGITKTFFGALVAFLVTGVLLEGRFAADVIVSAVGGAIVIAVGVSALSHSQSKGRAAVTVAVLVVAAFVVAGLVGR